MRFQCSGTQATTMKFLSTGDVVIHFEHHKVDGGPLVVFVNSLGTDLRIWDEVCYHLGGMWSVLRYDKRGHGLSGVGRAPYAIDDHVDDLVRLVDHVGATEVVICGLSVGGLIAQGFCARGACRVRALILSNTAHRIGTAESWNGRIEAVRSRGIEFIADAVLEKWFTPEFRSFRAAELAGCRAMLTRQPSEGYIGTCVAIRDADHSVLVRSITVPTLCLAGDHDGATPPDLVRSMAELIPGARFEVLAGAGHIPCVEQPGLFAARIAHFLGGSGLLERST